MEFLKSILGDDLYKQVEAAVNAYNEKPENKDKPLKLADLRTGDYVSKLKHGDVEKERDSVKQQLEEAQKLIDGLKKEGTEDQQKKVSEYETRIKELEAELQQQKVESALRAALVDAKVTDPDYIAFKIKEKGEIKLDANGKIKGIDDAISALKTQYPQHFPKETQKKIEEHKLERGEEGGDGVTRSDLLRKTYAERVQFQKENPELYEQLMNS